ncbi:hypothetical protein TcWFU_004350 [Taenia crassiceps]|uniref:SCP domain-containing protein n=1 Tax=Taenia crassiceps TaxID=6207 RepID=A0ABR4QDC3_9CEST
MRHEDSGIVYKHTASPHSPNSFATMALTLNVLVKAFCLVILLSAAACWEPTDVERAQVLEGHHRVREEVNPTASNMKLLRISRSLEHLAAYWASKCSFRRPNPKEHPHYRGLGVNMALTVGTKPALVDSICAWVKESKSYSYSSNTCSRRCEQYTQLIWAQTSEVGCAMRECHGVIPDWPDPQYITVCLYSPSGNYRKGRPYLRGPSCSKCGKRERCYRNQCMRSAELNQVCPTDRFPNPQDKYVPQCVLAQSESAQAASECETTSTDAQ